MPEKIELDPDKQPNRPVAFIYSTGFVEYYAEQQDAQNEIADQLELPDYGPTRLLVALDKNNNIQRFDYTGTVCDMPDAPDEEIIAASTDRHFQALGLSDPLAPTKVVWRGLAQQIIYMGPHEEFPEFPASDILPPEPG